MPRNLIVTMLKLCNYPMFCFSLGMLLLCERTLCQVNGVEQLEDIISTKQFLLE